MRKHRNKFSLSCRATVTVIYLLFSRGASTAPSYLLDNIMYLTLELNPERYRNLLPRGVFYAERSARKKKKNITVFCGSIILICVKIHI